MCFYSSQYASIIFLFFICMYKPWIVLVVAEPANKNGNNFFGFRLFFALLFERYNSARQQQRRLLWLFLILFLYCIYSMCGGVVVVVDLVAVFNDSAGSIGSRHTDITSCVDKYIQSPSKQCGIHSQHAIHHTHITAEPREFLKAPVCVCVWWSIANESKRSNLTITQFHY